LRFRFLVDEPADGPHNMAVDEALYRSALGPESLATVRLYEFRNPTVSYGYRQRVEDVIDPPACRRHGVEWVRRPTGGRALLHQHELTYSVACPVAGPLRGLSVRGVYDFVNGAIRQALTRLGVPVDGAALALRSAGRVVPPHLPCLALPERHEICSGAKKLVASAQRRTARGFLQHGAVLYRVDRSLWSRICPEVSRVVPLEAIGIEDLVPDPPPRSALAAALRASFEEAFDGAAEPAELDPQERMLARSLRGKYEWDEGARRASVG
jgi:lipoate-protein ligase A